MNKTPAIAKVTVKMDEQALNELLECSVCLERLDHTSKVLPCQHTFCRRCLDEIVSTKKELRCPECRTLVSYRVEDLPANILLIRLLEGLKHANQTVSSTSSSSTGAFRAKPARRHESLNKLPHVPGCKRQLEAKALYNYDAREPGDLPFKKGEIINVSRQIDQNWYYGELNGQVGYFPSSYVQIITNFSSSLPQVKALYDFDIKDENEKDCLKFQKDEILQLIRKVDDNWLEGRRGDKIGIFPLSFVELNDSAKTLVASRSRSSSSSSVGVSDGVPSGTSCSRSSASVPGSRLPCSSFQQIWQHVPQQRERAALHSPTPNTAANAAASLPPPPLNASMAAAMASASTQQKRHSFTATSHTHSANSSPTVQQRRSLELSPTSGAMPPTSPLHVALPPPPAPSCSGNVGAASAMKLLVHLESSGQVSDDIKPGTSEGTNPDPTSGKTDIYSALYNYKPQKEDEIELRKGDYYTVTEKCQDGWYKGHCLKTGVNGVFPGNYVQISRQSSTFGSVNPNLRGKEIPSASSSVSSADMNNQPGPVFYGNPPPPCSGNMDTPPPAPPPATVSQPHLRAVGTASCHATSSCSTNLHRQSACGTTARARTLHHAPSVSSPSSSILAAAYHSNNNNNIGSGTTSVGGGSALSPSVSSSILAAAYSNNNNNCSGASGGVVGGSTLSPSVSSSSQLSSSSSSITTHAVVEIPGSKSHTCSGGNASSSSSLKNAASMGSCGGAGAHHNQNLNPSSSSSHRNMTEFAALQHSMAASASITPPNVVAGISSTVTSHCTSKEKKEKKDKDKPSLVKRLTMGKGKKSKSPSEGEDLPLQLSLDTFTGHARCGSYPSDGRSTDPVRHKKSGSLDFSTSSNLTKTCKQKMVTKYRCIAPYPPQGEMELELKIGDIVLVYKKWDDGWYKGALQRNGRNGLFPGSFVTKCD